LPDRDPPDAQIARTVALARDVLGAGLLAVYLHGSAVEGGLRPDSDLDLLFVLARPTTDAERHDLLTGLLRLSGRGDPSGRARSLEVTAVVRSDVVPWRFPPRLDLQYGDWWRREIEAGEPDPWTSPNPDLAILLTVARRSGRPLIGPPPGELLDIVPAGDVTRAAVDGIPGLLADLQPDTRNVLLTLARIWATVVTGDILPKGAAADWAIARLGGDHRGVLVLARDAYRDGLVEDWGDRMDAATACASALVAAIDRASRPAPTGQVRLRG
jgi:streptomycin 3"-adenylyltransferase